MIFLMQLQMVLKSLLAGIKLSITAYLNATMAFGADTALILRFLPINSVLIALLLQLNMCFVTKFIITSFSKIKKPSGYGQEKSNQPIGNMRGTGIPEVQHMILWETALTGMP